ncbi:hypothetical protein [Caproicibacter fermentans]|uniref:hypothetical protein n=1 Tax=Caproicibacter fermentans TaxID=2576756 RepID=UPI0012ECBF49|nr:hypothetical protein [Caproicibacter fermentans]
MVKARTGRASNDQKRVRKSEDLPGTPEFSDEGPASDLEEKPDAMKAETGRASNDQKRVRKRADLPGMPEFSSEGPESGFKRKLDTVKARTGRTSRTRCRAKADAEKLGTGPASDHVTGVMLAKSSILHANCKFVK